jgi:hypothetical protein
MRNMKTIKHTKRKMLETVKIKLECLILEFHFKKTLERSDPKGLSAFGQCPELLLNSNSCPSQLELGALSKLHASRMLV